MHFLTPVEKSITHQVPLIPIRDVIVYPTNEIVLTFGRKKSMVAVNAALAKDKLVALFTQIDPKVEDPTTKDLYKVGTLCVVERTLKTDGELNALVHGIARIKLIKQVEDNRQIRKMCDAVGYPVMRLIRTRFGPWDLEGLESGKYRRLNSDEIEAMLK